MSNDLNQCNFIGRLGKDPEVRFNAKGEPIANITLAVGESWKDRNTGQKQEKTEWVRIVFFGGIAQVVADYLKKGSKIYVSGKQKTRKWQDQSGQDKYTTEVVVDSFNGVLQMLDSKSDGAPNQNQSPQQNFKQNQQNPTHQGSGQAPQTGTAQQTSGGFEEEFDDDIPF